MNKALTEYLSASSSSTDGYEDNDEVYHYSRLEWSDGDGSTLPTTSPAHAGAYGTYYDLTHGLDSFTNTTLRPALDINVDGVKAAVLLNLLAFIVMMAVYELLLRKMPEVYAGRKLGMAEKQRANLTRMVSDLPILGTYLPFAWVWPVQRVQWKTVRDVSGLDAYFFLRYIRICLKITAISGFWGVIILWPTYYTGNGEMTGFYRLSMSNILQSHWRLWVPTIFLWLMTFYVVYLLDTEFKHFVSVRMEFLGRGGGEISKINAQTRYSIMVEKIPPELRSHKALFNYFNELFPGKVHSANVVMNVQELEQLINRRLRIVRRLEKAQAFHRATGKWASHVVGTPRLSILGIECLPLCKWGSSSNENVSKVRRYDMGEEIFEKGELVDSVEYYTRELAMLNDQVLSLQKEFIKVAAISNDSHYGSDWFRRIVDHVLSLDHSDYDPDEGRPCSPSEQLQYGSFQQSSEENGFEKNDSMKRLPSKAFNWNPQGLLEGDYLDANGEPRLIQPGGEDKHKTFWRRFIGKIGLDFVEAVYSLFKKHIDAVVDSVMGQTMSSTGFVTFLDLTSVTYAASAPLCHVPDILEAEVAPEPRDIIWSNATHQKSFFVQRQNTASILVAIGALLWSIPLLLIQVLATADSLSRVPGMGWLATLTSNNPNLAGFINGYLPVIALLTIIMILPMIFEWVALSYERRKTHSDVQNSILNRYFYYQLANIYVTVTAGSLWDSLFDIMQRPSAAFEILGRSLPTVVGYFVSFLLTKVLAGLPMVLLRGGSLFKMLFYRCCFRESLLTQRELDNAIYRKEGLIYGWEYPTQLLVIVICFTYACMSPVILLCGAIYFQLALLVYKKQILHVYTPEYEDGGQMFPSVVQRTLIGLICGQMTFLGYVILRQGIYQPVILFPLPFFTTSIMRRFEKLYIRPSTHLSLQRAQQLDHDEQEIRLREEFNTDTFRQPALATEAIYPMPYRRYSGGLPPFN